MKNRKEKLSIGFMRMREIVDKKSFYICVNTFLLLKDCLITV